MKFASPELLWLLLAVPLLVGAYLWALRRNKKGALRYASLSLVKTAIGPGQRFRRHVPPLLFLLAVIAAIVAMARPEAVVTLPSEQRTIIMAIDVSLSMRASDVEPTRLEAAQAAAKSFVQDQPADVLVGIVTFAGTAAVVQAPTRDREALVAAIDKFELQRNTAIGSGIVVSLATLFPQEGIDLESMLFPGSYSGSRSSRALPSEKDRKTEKKEFTPVAPASYKSGAIILLTDGRRTTGPDSLDAAKLAADHGVRVYTVGFGQTGGGTANIDGYSMYMMYDEETLKAIADITKAEYFHAASGEELRKVYQSLNASLVLERKETEVSALAVAVAAVLLVGAAALSLLWFNRVV